MTFVVYASPVFRNADGAPRMFKIPASALTTYAKRDACLMKIMEMGGINAKFTPELIKIRSKMMAAKRKIANNGWFSSVIENVGA